MHAPTTIHHYTLSLHDALPISQSTDGTAHSYFNEAPYNSYNIAAKTGTAENEIYEDGKKVANTENHSLVAYAPFDNPEIAIAVLVPNTGKIGRASCRERV